MKYLRDFRESSVRNHLRTKIKEIVHKLQLVIGRKSNGVEEHVVDTGRTYRQTQAMKRRKTRLSHYINNYKNIKQQQQQKTGKCKTDYKFKYYN